MPFSILFRESPKGIRKLLLFYLFTWFYKGRNVQTNVIKQYKNIKRAEKFRSFFVAEKGKQMNRLSYKHKIDKGE